MVDLMMPQSFVTIHWQLDSRPGPVEKVARSGSFCVLFRAFVHQYTRLV
jgi:hypothetical protein